MNEPFLYEELNALSRYGVLDKTVSDSMLQNLNPRYEIRPCQQEAFARFLYCWDRNYPGKKPPLHFLFNMATGSGKTLVMAGLILRLYEKGHRNFLFFVNQTNIVEKTKANFLNPASSKYLFAPDIVIGDRRVRINAVDNFDSANPRAINIHFTTIQGLHSRLTNPQENAVSFAGFRGKKIVLIADEAHHMSAATHQQLEFKESTWENTVDKILQSDRGNILLEFTATHDYEKPAMRDKYRNKVIIRYDLAQFRQDGFSKDVVLLRSDFHRNDRILQALVISQYRREIAAKHQINLKPVILFKSPKIKDSEEVQENFHAMVGGLTADDIAKIRRSEISVVRRAFAFFDGRGIGDMQLAERLQSEFGEEFCLSANEDKERNRHQILLNTLEDKDNRIRAIFAVQKLSEGWDVLNLFDIVRCHENRESRNKTVAEAQLIGRGARYYPFVAPDNGDRNRRKFDGMENELRVLEEMHYHSINDSHYISEIRAALIEQGVLDEMVKRPMKIKKSFKETAMYKYGAVWLNERVRKSDKSVFSFSDLSVKRRNYAHTAAAGHGNETSAFGGNRNESADGGATDIRVKNVPRNIVESAIARNPFFAFNRLRRYFPNLSSAREFISSDDYLGGLAITFRGDETAAKNRAEQIAAMGGLLAAIAEEAHRRDGDYVGTKTFKRNAVNVIFTDKIMKFSRDNPRARIDEDAEGLVADRDWFVFDAMHGTSEEKNFVRMLDRKISELKERYEDIYLLRNEGHFAIYNFADGRPFEPDFVLLLRDKNGKTFVYQIFIEPKGAFIADKDQWKEDFLREITAEFESKTLPLGDDSYRILGVPFFNSENENDFIEKFDSALSLPPF